jgi:hypothetical protein
MTGRARAAWRACGPLGGAPARRVLDRAGACTDSAVRSERQVASCSMPPMSHDRNDRGRSADYNPAS